MPLSPPQRRPALIPGNQTLTNADQTVTKVDKTDHRQPSPESKTPAKRGTIATAPTISIPKVSTLAVNPAGAPRTTLNKSEHRRRPLAGGGINWGSKQVLGWQLAASVNTP